MADTELGVNVAGPNPAGIAEQITAAKAAKYDDAAIVQHLLTMPEYQDKVNAALNAKYTPSDIISFLAPPPASPGTQLLPGGAVVMDRAQSKYLKAPPAAAQVLQDVGGAAIAGAGFSAAAPQILKGAGALATGSGLAPLRPIGAALTFLGQGAQAAGLAARTATGFASGAASEIGGKAVEEQGGGAVAAEVARFAAGAVGPDVARLTSNLTLRVLSSIIPGSHTERTASIIAKDIAKKLQETTGRPLTVSEQQNIDNMVALYRGAPQSEWEKIANIIGTELDRGATAIRRAGESEAAFVQRKAKSGAADLTKRATTSLAETNATAARLHNEASRALNAAEDAARVEIEAARQSGIPLARTVNYTETLKQEINAKAKATIAGVGDTTQELTAIGNRLRTAATKREEDLRNAASIAYTKTQTEVLAQVAKLEKANIRVDSMPAYKALVADLRSQLLPGKHSPEVAAAYQKILTQITSAEPKPLSALAQMQQELSGAATSAPAPVSFQAIDDARRMLGEAFRGQPAEGYAAIGETAMKKYYPMLSKVQKDFAGEKQAQLLDDYATSRPGLEVFISKAGKKVTGIDPKTKEQFLTDAASIPSTFFSTPTQFNNLVKMVGGRDLAVKAARDYAANQLSVKQTSKEIETWMMTSANRDFLNSVPEVRDAVLQHKNALAVSERASGIFDARINKLREQAGGFTSAAEKRATAIRAGGSTQSNELTQQAEQMTRGGLATAEKLKAEADKLLSQAKVNVTDITTKSADAADLVFSQHSAMKNVRELIEKGDMARWGAVAPIIERSPNAKIAVYEAVRQVTADTASSKGSLQKFNETIRPALERFGMLTTEQADELAAGLAKIAANRIPEPQKLTQMQRLLLQGVAGYAASGSTRLLLPSPPNN